MPAAEAAARARQVTGGENNCAEEPDALSTQALLPRCGMA